MNNQDYEIQNPASFSSLTQTPRPPNPGENLAQIYLVRLEWDFYLKLNNNNNNNNNNNK